MSRRTERLDELKAKGLLSARDEEIGRNLDREATRHENEIAAARDICRD